MLYFLGASLFSFLVFEIAALAIPVPYRDGSSFSWGDKITIRLSASTASTLRTIIAIALTVSVCFIALIVHNFVSENRLQILRTYESNVIVGFIFGIVLGIWINAVFSADPSARDRKQTILMFCLIPLFIVGAFGDQFGRLLQNAAGRLNSFSAGGVSLTLNSLTNSKPEGFVGSSINAQGAAQYHPASPGSGIGFLAQLPVTMKQDCEIIDLSRQYNFLNKLFHSFSRTAPGVFDAPAACNDANYETMISSVDLFVATPNKCLHAIYEKTQDTAFLRRALFSFSPIVTGLRSIRNGNGGDYEETSVKALVDVSNQILEYLETRLPSTLMRHLDKHDVLFNIQKSCDGVMDLRCHVNLNSPAPDPDKPDRDPDKPAHDPNKPDPRPEVLQRCAWDAILINGSRSQLENQALKPKYEAQTEIEHSLRPKYQDMMLTFQQPRSDIYVTVLASVLSVALGDYETGLSILNDWLQSHEDVDKWVKEMVADADKTKRFDIAFQSIGKDHVTNEQEAQWLVQRGRMTFAYLSSSWLDNLGDGATDKMRDAHLQNAQAIIESYNSFGFMEALLTLAQGGVGKCPFDYIVWQNLVYNYDLTKLTYATHALKQKNFDSNYKDKATQYVNEVLTINPSCLEALDSSDSLPIHEEERTSSTLYADAKNLYARIVAKNVPVDADQRSDEEIKNWNAARQAVREGIAKVQCNSETEGSRNQSFLQEIQLDDRQDSCQNLRVTEDGLGH